MRDFILLHLLHPLMCPVLSPCKIRFLPPKFDYSRPIPNSLLPRPAAVSNSPSNGSMSEIELGPLLNGDAVSHTRERSNGVARNRRGGGVKPRRDSRPEDNTTGVRTTTSMSEDTRDTPTLDCVICYNEIDVNDRQGYMLAPCDHIFHRQCLEQWMEVKVRVECFDLHHVEARVSFHNLILPLSLLLLENGNNVW